MNLHLHFILLNSDFNQSIAEDFYDGEESEDNIKHLWEDELAVSEPLIDFKIKHNESYFLKGFLPNNEPFSFEIRDVSMVECNAVSGNKIQFAISKKLIKKTDKIVDDKTNETHLYFYLKDAIAFQNPIAGVYIIKQDFPKELIINKTTNND